ncbi:MAG TPA: hypothetical protein VIF82_10815 [Burkholderiaceae bacterium]|jgi:hypothetical protein
MLLNLKNLKHRIFIKNKIKPLERFTKDIQWTGNFNAPEAYYDYYFVDRDIGIVGEISGGLSPLLDTFYVCEIKVPVKHQRDDYEVSMLANIAEFYGVPITPLHGIDGRILERISRKSVGNFQLNAQINSEEMSAEILKWRH